ncbi:MAG: protein kinase [Acidobacteriaceae bacterium]
MREGATISHYRVLQRLGNGASGVVCKGEDLLLNRFVALKYLSSAAVLDSNQKERLLVEARAASALDHPNIGRIHEIAQTEDGEIVLVMAFYDGETLAERIAKAPLELSIALQIESQMLAGLHHAHENGVLHRDIKPSNVMVNRRNEVKIVDFGLAKRIDAEQRDLTETGMMVGTISYLSPEQILCKGIDHRADVWASGVVFYEMLSGRLPFTGASQYAVFDCIVHGRPVPMLTLRPELPAVVEQIVARSLEKNPMYRYQSALDFQNDVQALLQTLSHPFRAAPVSSSRASALASALMDGQEQSILVLPFSNADPHAAQDTDYFGDGLTDEIITDLSGIRSLRVICRMSAMRLKGTTESPQQIARDLNVRYVLEGNVRVSGNNIRVTAKLVDPLTDSLIWAEKYRGVMEDVFEIQESISRQIVSALKLKLSPSEEMQLNTHPIHNIHAYQYYLKAKQEILSYSREGLERALDYLRKGEELIGKNALLLSSMGQVYWQYVNGGISSDPEYLANARRCATEALHLEPDAPHAHRLLGLIALQEGETQQAVRLLKKAIAADPNDSDSLSWYSAICALSGKPHEVRKTAMRVLAVDPLTPVYRFIPGLISLMAGEFTAALGPFEEAIKIDPQNSMLHLCHGQILAMLGRIDEAIREFTETAEREPENFFAQLGMLYNAALRGDGKAAEQFATEELKQIAACDTQYPWNMAECYSLLGDYQEALRWLNLAIDKGFINYPMLNELDPLLAGLRRSLSEEFAAAMRRARQRWEAFEV